MNSKGHFFVSLMKSAIRMCGCYYTLKTGNIFYMAALFILAELLGIMEECVDKR